MTISARDARILSQVAQTDEPIIVFRAQDKHTAGVLRDYLSRLWSDAEVQDDIKDAVIDKAREFEEWQAQNPDRLKSPDLGNESHLEPAEPTMTRSEETPS
jgi:hypothetical protein